MRWPPQVGEPLPRATECWCEQTKLVGWILDPVGHGLEWERVFRVTAADQERVWAALAAAAAAVPISEIRDRGDDGVVCGLADVVEIGGRTSRVTMSWHYATAVSAPRLVTAYPRP
jgi:hypothetical protein